MTDISVNATGYQVEKRSWLIPFDGDSFGFTDNGTLDVSAFTAGTHYPNGYIPSGTRLGVITATGLLGPYDAAASDGRQTFAGYLFGSTKIPNLLDLTKDVGCAVVKAFAVVKLSKLPIPEGTAGRGSDATVIAAAVRIQHIA